MAEFKERKPSNHPPMASADYQQVLRTNLEAEPTAESGGPFAPARPDPVPRILSVPQSQCQACGGAFVAGGGFEFCELCGREAPATLKPAVATSSVTPLVNVLPPEATPASPVDPDKPKATRAERRKALQATS